MIVSIEYVDYDEAYGFDGKVIARSDVRGWSVDEMLAEQEEMLHLLRGGCERAPVIARWVEVVPAVV